MPADPQALFVAMVAATEQKLAVQATLLMQIQIENRCLSDKDVDRRRFWLDTKRDPIPCPPCGPQGGIFGAAKCACARAAQDALDDLASLPGAAAPTDEADLAHEPAPDDNAEE